jgi:RNase adapter protein RapZ
MYNRHMGAMPPRLVILTGMSGAGKSTALRCFEDLSYFCIDNLPPTLIETFLQLVAQVTEDTRDIAVVCDVRSGDLFRHFRDVVQLLSQRGYKYEVLFFDCDDRVLVSRFSEARRMPPLGTGVRVEDAVSMERQRLDPLKELATRVVDTTNLTPRQLRELILGTYGRSEGLPPLSVIIVSFGFKYGLPADADFVFDTRFLPNPFYIEELRPLTGIDPEVVAYVLGNETAREYLEHVHATLTDALQHYLQVNKFSTVVAMGCTGGKHRSVSLASELATRLVRDSYRVVVQHRDVERS